MRRAGAFGFNMPHQATVRIALARLCSAFNVILSAVAFISYMSIDQLHAGRFPILDAVANGRASRPVLLVQPPTVTGIRRHTVEVRKRSQLVVRSTCDEK